VLVRRQYAMRRNMQIYTTSVCGEDISQQAQTAEELPESERRLRDSVFRNRMAHLGKLSSATGLLVNLIHEISNPMDGAIRYMQLLLDQMPENDTTREYVKQSLAGLKQMQQRIMDGLRQVARGSTSVSQPTGVREILYKLLSSFQDDISGQNITTETEFDENIPCFFSADVEEIFRNIMKNAIQAMPDGGTLSVRARMLSSELLEVRLGDTGTGIPSSIQERMFDAFFTTREMGEGAGLGLCIALAVAESYSGSIEVKSELGKGTTFIVRLPIGENRLTIADTDSDAGSCYARMIWG
jgi:signal transduction histidine kinase